MRPVDLRAGTRRWRLRIRHIITKASSMLSLVTFAKCIRHNRLDLTVKFTVSRGRIEPLRDEHCFGKVMHVRWRRFRQPCLHLRGQAKPSFVQRPERTGAASLVVSMFALSALFSRRATHSVYWSAPFGCRRRLRCAKCEAIPPEAGRSVSERRRSSRSDVPSPVRTTKSVPPSA